MMTEKSLRGRIVVTSYDLFSSRGVKSVTMDMISAELSISKRTLYEEFGSKNELLECVLYEMNKYYQARNEQILDMKISAVEKIFMITSIQGERNDNEALFFHDIISNYPQLLENVVKANFEHNVGRVKMIIEKGCEEGFFDERVNIDVALDFFFDIKFHTNSRKEPNRLNMMHRYIIRTIFFLRSIATDKGYDEIDRLCEKNNINIYNK